jgi:hypothetical protein
MTDTLRDMFAMAALPSIAKQYGIGADWAALSYDLADAMLAEREKRLKNSPYRESEIKKRSGGG